MIKAKDAELNYGGWSRFEINFTSTSCQLHFGLERVILDAFRAQGFAFEDLVFSINTVLSPV